MITRSMVDKTSFRVYYIHTMKATILTLLVVVSTLTTACSTVGTISPLSYGSWDPRCTPRQYCPYTDPPAAIRTEPLR